MAVFLGCLTALADSGSEIAKIDERAEDLLVSPPEARSRRQTVTGDCRWQRNFQLCFALITIRSLT
jgi:hypothetical protein